MASGSDAALDPAAHIRRGGAGDRADWLRMRCALMPEIPAAEHGREVDGILRRPAVSVALLWDDPRGGAVALAEVSLRGHAEGCTSAPVGYVEALWVDPAFRGRGIARALLARAEAWAWRHGCREMASDARLDDEASRAAHARCGYQESARLVTFRKALAAAAAPERDAARAPPEPGVLVVEPASAPPWRAGLAHAVVIVLGALAFWHTDLWSDDPFYGGVLPLLDLLFVIYLLVAGVVLAHRRRRGGASPRRVSYDYREGIGGAPHGAPDDLATTRSSPREPPRPTPEARGISRRDDGS